MKLSREADRRKRQRLKEGSKWAGLGCELQESSMRLSPRSPPASSTDTVVVIRDDYLNNTFVYYPLF